MPKLSIITVSFNDIDNLVKTAKTVFEQSYKNIEYIVIDGGSSDGTADFIKCNEKKISHWIIEKDEGIYDAMNKGITLASGDFLCFMNCGDYLVDKCVVENVAKKISADNINTSSIIYMDFRRNGIVHRQWKNNLEFYLYLGPICHQSLFIGKDVFANVGKYDLRYKITADHEHNLRSYKSEIPFVYFDHVFCCYAGGGLSELKSSKKAVEAEKKKIRSLYFTRRQRVLFEIMFRLTFPSVREILFPNGLVSPVRNRCRKMSSLILPHKDIASNINKQTFEIRSKK